MSTQEKPHFLIMTCGSICKDHLQDYLSKISYDTLICVDKGLEAADEMKLLPDYIIGDFDSVSQELLNKYKNRKEHSAVLKEYNPVKDSTDTEIAIDMAVRGGAGRITLFGATGTRVDHMLSNIGNLIVPLKKGIEAYILDRHNKIYLSDRSVVVKKEAAYGPYLSLIPFGGPVTGLTLKGMKYPLLEHTLLVGDSLGISNEIIAPQGEIMFRTGILLIIESRDK